MEALVASDDHADGVPSALKGDDADTIANANDAEMNAEYEEPSWDHEERMEEEAEQRDNSILASQATESFPPILAEGEDGETEEVMEYDQDASEEAAEEADEDGDIDIGEVDEGADVVIADEIDQVDQAGQDDSAYEQGTEEIQDVVPDDEQEQQHGDAPGATELESDPQPETEMATVSEQIQPATLRKSDDSEEPSTSDSTVEATTTDVLGQENEDAPGVESEPGATQETVTTGSTVGVALPADAQQGGESAKPASSSEKDAAGAAEFGVAEQSADTVEDDDQTGQGSSSESWDAEEEEEDEVVIEPIRLSFQDQSFAIFSADPESTSYLAWDEETDTLKAVPAPRLAVEEDVFWSPLEALFNALRVKDALGEFLEGESGSELVMTFPELELSIREDNVYAREISLTHLIRLYHQLGLRDSMHIRVSEDSRFISQYNLLAQQIAQAQKQGAEDISGDGKGAPEDEEAPASTLPVAGEGDSVHGEDGTPPDHNVGAPKTEGSPHEEDDEASADVADDVDLIATEVFADRQAASFGASSEVIVAENADDDVSVAQDAEAEQRSNTFAAGEDENEAVGEAGGGEEAILEYQEEGEEQPHDELADQEEGEVGEEAGSHEEADLPDVGDNATHNQEGLDDEADAEDEEEGDYVDETEETAARGTEDEAAVAVAEEPADQRQVAEGDEEAEDAVTAGGHGVYTEEVDASEAADLGTADYEEHLPQEAGETTPGSMNGDRAGAATSPLLESIPNGASKKRYADDDATEEASSETEVKKIKVT